MHTWQWIGCHVCILKKIKHKYHVCICKIKKWKSEARELPLLLHSPPPPIPIPPLHHHPSLQPPSQHNQQQPPHHHLQSSPSKTKFTNIFTIDVGSQMFQTTKQTLTSTGPKTFFSTISQTSSPYTPFIDRNLEIFSVLLRTENLPGGEGRIKFVNVLFTISPSTPTRINEFFIVDRRRFTVPLLDHAVICWRCCCCCCWTSFCCCYCWWTFSCFCCHCCLCLPCVYDTRTGTNWHVLSEVGILRNEKPWSLLKV